MLVLSRQIDESIMIEYKPKSYINLTVVDIRGERVRLGIDAPIEVPVHRREVYDMIAQESKTRRLEKDVDNLGGL